jgi:hypothetical protein
MKVLFLGEKTKNRRKNNPLGLKVLGQRNTFMRKRKVPAKYFSLKVGHFEIHIGSPQPRSLVTVETVKIIPNYCP